MDNFSLEDDDYGDMFITQNSKDNIEIVPDDDNSNKELFLGLLKNDFSSPCLSLLKGQSDSSHQYSDISDYEEESMDQNDSEPR